METLLRQLMVRRQRLNEAAEEGRLLISRCQDGGVREEVFTLCRLGLKQKLDAFEKLFLQFLTKYGEHEMIGDDFSEDQLKAEDVLTELEAATLSNRSVSTTTKLPKLSLPMYNGDKLKWSEFWDRFRANVHHQSIADADKLSYLLSCLEGTALDTVSGFTTTNDNYQLAVEALEKRFGSKDALIDAHYTAINNLPKAEYTSASCRSVLDALERHFRVLEKLGEPVNGNHLRAMILTKFPERVIHEHHIIGSEDNSMVSIRNNLDKIVAAMERSSGLNLRPDLDSQPSSSSTTTTETLHVKIAQPPLNSKVNQVNRKRKQDNSVEASPVKRARRPCLFCKLPNHASSDCRKFKTIEARKSKLPNRCHHCLKRNHDTASCKKKISCFRCKEDHLLIFCPKAFEGENFTSIPLEIKTLCKVSNDNGYTFLQTAVATIQNPKSKETRGTRLLLDSGSQRSYITERAAKLLGLPTLKRDLLLIYTFGATKPKKTLSPSTVVNIETKRRVKKSLPVNIVSHITDRIPITTFKHHQVDIFADDHSIGEHIDLLVGNDFYSSFIRKDKIKIAANLYLLDTDFGWILSGSTASDKGNDILSVVTYCQCHVPNCPYFAEPDLPLRDIDINFLWSLESIGITDSPKSTRQEEAVRHFNETVLYQNGRYQVKWPWIQYPPDLSSNFGLALGRLKSVLKRMNEDTLNEYDAILKEQLDLGIIEIVDENSDKGNHPLHYLPHHMIKQKAKRGRLVYDASAKTMGTKSLNECLYSGPSMLEDLTALLLKFRTMRIGITADVEKAFLQVGLQQEDRDVTRFLWIKDTNKEPTGDNLLHLRFCRVPFGVISSPFLLTATIRYHMNQSNESLLKTIANRCYADNLVTVADSVQEATQIYQQTKNTFDQLSMNMRDWASNNAQFMDTIPKQFRSNQTENVKVLGLNWNLKNDNLRVKVTENNFNPDIPVNTKRKFLRTLARIYDPCGFVCPLVLPMKILFQNICERKVKWDTVLPVDLVESIKTTLEQLKPVRDVEIPRYIGINTPIKDTKFSLHCFTDASKNGYAAVLYLKAEDERQSSVSFVMAKSRVSQAQYKDDLKIPKLELLGFLIGSRLLRYVRTNLELQIQKECLWTDSQVILAWMNSDKLLPPFVTNRVNEIKRNNPQTEMCYVHTKSNPADIATRPELFEKRKELWYNGPEFLKEDETRWPINRYYDATKTFFSVREGLQESSQDITACEMEVLNEENQDMSIDKIVTLDDSTRDKSTLETVIEIKESQSQNFRDELSGKRTHLARNLDLFLDVDGILRCRGRMTNTTWSYDKKYPILLPKNSELTRKIIKNTHESNYHVGASHTLNIIREKYWIPQVRAQVQKVLRSCPQCVKHGGGLYKLPGAPALPPERVNYHDPFTFTGVDYFGPLMVSTAMGTDIRWVALFTCLTVRAIHLEVVKDMSAEECLLALRRFAATRGVPKKLYSDNATNFKLTAEVMEQPFCVQNKIEWKFIPQLAPWHGGFYERLVALVKHCLKRTLEKNLLNDSKLLTVMKEVEAVINSRPLTRVGPELEHVLRPQDFLSLRRCLTMEPSLAQLPAVGTTTKVDLIGSWKRGLKIMDEFKKMFIANYLTSLRERYHHAPRQPRIKSNRVPKIGDLVQVKSDDKNRNRWKTGKIVSLIKGHDGEHRVAKVQVQDSTLTRSIGHLYPLEVDDEAPQNNAVDAEVPHHGADSGAERRSPSPVLITDRTTETEDIDKRGVLDTDPNVEPVDPIEPIESLETERDGTNDFTLSDNEEVQPREEGTRIKRDAAIRAREKILEWTRLLFTRLE